MCRRLKCRPSAGKYNKVINLTSKRIRFYDENRNIAICEPECNIDSLGKMDRYTMVIVERGDYCTGFGEIDTVYAKRHGKDSNGEPLSILFRKRDNALVKFLPQNPIPEGNNTYFA